VLARAINLAWMSRLTRRGMPVGAVLGACLWIAATHSAVAAAQPGHREQLRFMWAMAGQESGWDYYARNASSGAFGKYQIMPFNWPLWAEQVLGNARADQTPWHQEEVAYGKIRELYVWLGSWKRVAYWWLTGDTEARERRWSSYARGYVQAIMRLRHRAPRDGGPMPARTPSRAGHGDWRRSQGALRLHLGIAGRTWARRGGLRDGQILRVHDATTKGNGVHWIAVVTRDGRLGWLPQASTLPAERPSRFARWHDVEERGHGEQMRDRAQTRPRPR
jgi:hypothetical protein